MARPPLHLLFALPMRPHLHLTPHPRTLKNMPKGPANVELMLSLGTTKAATGKWRLVTFAS